MQQSQAAEEEAARKAAEEEAARKAAEEEAARKAAEEEAARKAAEEEAARKAAEEEAARKAAEEESARKAAEEAARKAAEEEAARKAAEEEAARKAAEEEAARRAAEEEAARKAAEEEASRKSAEEAMRLIAEQAAAAAKDDPAAALLNQQQQIAKLTAEALSAFDPFQSKPLPDNVAASALGAPVSSASFDPFASDAPANVVPSADAPPPVSEAASDFSTPMLGALAAQLQMSAESATPPSALDNPFATPGPSDSTGPATLSAANPFNNIGSDPSNSSIDNPFAVLGNTAAEPASSDLAPASAEFASSGFEPVLDPWSASIQWASDSDSSDNSSSDLGNASVLPAAETGIAGLSPAFDAANAPSTSNSFPSLQSLLGPINPTAGGSASGSGSPDSSISMALSQSLDAASAETANFANSPSTAPDVQPGLGDPLDNPFGSPPAVPNDPMANPFATAPSAVEPMANRFALPAASDESVPNPFPPPAPAQLDSLLHAIQPSAVEPSAAPSGESQLGGIANPFSSAGSASLPPSMDSPFSGSSATPHADAESASSSNAGASIDNSFGLTMSGSPSSEQSSESAPQTQGLSAAAISSSSDQSTPSSSDPSALTAAESTPVEVASLAPASPPTPAASPERPIAPATAAQPAPSSGGIPNPFGASSVPANSPLTPPPVAPLSTPVTAQNPLASATTAPLPVSDTQAPLAPLSPPRGGPTPSGQIPIVPGNPMSTSGSFLVGTGSGVMGREPAPAAVGGLVAKLEQQAQRANAKLEQKLDEIQGRLQRDLTLTISKLAVKEQASLRNILSLKTVLSRRLGGTSEELKQQIGDSVGTAFDTISDVSNSGSTDIENLSSTLSVEVLQQFDELSTSILGLTGGFSEKCQGQHEQGLASLQEVLLLMHSRLEEVGRQHAVVLQRTFEQLEQRSKELSQHSDTELSSTYERLRAELAAYRQESLSRLDTLSSHLLEAINESIALSLLNIQIHTEIRGSNVLLPRLLNYKQTLSIKAEQLREKYKEEVEKLGVQKLAELRPIIASQRDEMEKAARDARQLKSTVEVGQREEFEKTYAILVKFVDEKIAEARGMAGFSADELGKIERSVSALSDAATIESDAELAQARKQVLTKLQSIGVQLQTNVNDSLRGQISAMEDKGRMLQEELISSMEGNAYAVRKSSEASILRVRQALETAYQQISELQNHYLQ